MDLDLSPTDVDVSHRTSNRNDAGIIIKLNSRSVRDTFFQSRKKLKDKTVADLGFEKKRDENGKYLLMKVSPNEWRKMSLKKNGLFKYVWTKNGTTMIRKTDTSKLISILSKNDITKYASQEHGE